MEEKMVKIKEKTVAQKQRIFSERVYRLLQGTRPRLKDDVNLPVPPLRIRENESSWENLLTSEKKSDRLKRRGMKQHIGALLDLNDFAKKNDLDLAEAARQLIKNHQETIENTWVSILDRNRPLEIKIRWAASILKGMQESRNLFKGKIHWLPISIEEAVTQDGSEYLSNYLSYYINRPDCRKGRGYVAFGNWAGSPDKLDLLNRITHKHRAMLWTDCPRYGTEEQLWADAQDGGTLEQLPGPESHKRHCVSFGNWVRVRHRFIGKYAQENEDVFIPSSGPQFGRQLDLIAQGKIHEPAASWDYPLIDCDGTEMDLRLDREGAGHNLLANHRQNPILRSAAGSQRCVNWGAFTLGPVQIGEGLVEMEVARYTEWVLNKCCMFQDLEEGQEKSQKMLSTFVTENSGPGRMFRAESGVDVKIDPKANTLIVEMQLAYRTVAERAIIRMSKKHLQREEPAEIAVECSA